MAGDGSVLTVTEVENEEAIPLLPLVKSTLCGHASGVFEKCIEDHHG